MRKKKHRTCSKKIAPTTRRPVKNPNCKKCGDTGLVPDVDADGYHGFHFCDCPNGITASKTYEHSKCPLCQNGSYATRWKTIPGSNRKKYHQVRCPHFRKKRKNT